MIVTARYFEEIKRIKYMRRYKTIYVATLRKCNLTKRHYITNRQNRVGGWKTWSNAESTYLLLHFRVSIYLKILHNMYTSNEQQFQTLFKNIRTLI